MHACAVCLTLQVVPSTAIGFMVVSDTHTHKHTRTYGGAHARASAVAHTHTACNVLYTRAILNCAGVLGV